MRYNNNKKLYMKFRQALFWDVNPKNIDPKKHSQYIIERILDLGNDKEVKWLLGFYSKRKLKNVVAKSRCLRPRTKTLWTLFFKNQ
jgi:hypothetical protein